MKKLVWPLLLAAFVAAAALNATPVTFKAHKGLKGLGGDPVNCAYCHVKHKVEKKKGQDHKELQKRPACSMKDCHCN